MMGVGKSTTGLALAAELGLSYVDSDTDIERLTGSTGAEFAAEHGVALLHKLESAVLIGAVGSDVPSVISAAGSTVEDDMVRSVLPRRARVVRLELPIAETIARQATGEHRRPMTAEELTRLARRRDPYFVEVCDLALDGMRPTEDLVSDVIAAFT